MKGFSRNGVLWTATTLLFLLTAIIAMAGPPKLSKSNTAKATHPANSDDPVIRYNRDVRPILSENCFPCHGPDSAARKAGLRLDRYADAIARRAGPRAIIPGDPIGSEVTRRLLKDAKDPLLMPPVAAHKSLTPAQKRTILLWIEQGATYEPQWSYIAPKRPALPNVKNTAWVRNPIDRFVLARLEQAGLTPAPEADRRTLARRLSLDLTGLPPEPADVEAFVADKSPNAYEKLVDKFLASPHWGEHRGRYWLDAARYADTHGIHIDNYREMWSYRDWVINAFNANMPFDQFTIEQLAGDLLPNPTLDQRIATGFNRCNITTSEGGAIDEEYYVLYTRDRTETVSQVWLGTTAGCAVCHDHKFDPLTQRDFYQMAAFFNNTTQAAMDGNVQNTPPIVPVPRAEDRPRFNSLQSEITTARQKIEERKNSARPDFENWAKTAKAETLTATLPDDALAFSAPLSEGKGTQVAVTVDGKPLTTATTGGEPNWDSGYVAEKAFQKKPGLSVVYPTVGDFENNQAFSCSLWLKLPQQGANGAVVARMDEGNNFRGWDVWLEGNRIGSHIISHWPSDAVKVISRDALTPGKWHHVCITYNGGLKKESLTVYIDGMARATDPQADALRGSIKTSVPFRIGQRSSGQGAEGVSLQALRVYTRALTANEVQRLATAPRAAYLLTRNSNLTAPEKDELFAGWLSGSDTEFRERTAKLAALEDEKKAIEGRGTIAHVAQEKNAEAMAYVLARGDYDKRRDPVKAQTPAMLPTMPADFPKNRLGFAKWLLLPEHPLTARVTVNRFWQEIFGQGLVRTVGDFGVSGEVPSHPELLDWLAVEFRNPSDGKRPWDMKAFFKKIVMSATYRQAATVTPAKRTKDRDNRLLSRGPRFRMDGEMVRDYALASSNLLVRRLGGPSVKPYQPDGVWEAVAMIGSNTRDYKRDSGESLYRRSVYTFWKRSAPPASLEIFNAPSREVCTVRRERTNTPLQALVTLNDVQYVEAARVLAEKALKRRDTSDAGRINYIARRLLARPLSSAELVIVTHSLDDLETFYKKQPDEAKQLLAYGETKSDASLPAEKLAAYTMLTNQLMNLDEMLNK